MRFWQKIFLISLAVLTVAVNTIAYLLIGNNHQLNKGKKKLNPAWMNTVLWFHPSRLMCFTSATGPARRSWTIPRSPRLPREFSYLFTLDNLYIQLNKGEERVFSNLPGICRTIYTRM